MNNFTLEIVTPEKLAFSEPVEQVSVPSVDGQLTILPHHVPLFATLMEGELIIRSKGSNRYLAIGGGFIEVTKSKVIVLVTRAYHANELNESAIIKAQKEAKERIAQGATGEELRAAQLLLRSTLIDLKVLNRRKKLV